MGQLDQLMRVMEDRKKPRKRSTGYARVDIDSLDDLTSRQDDIVTQLNELAQTPTAEPVDLRPLQADISRMTSAVDSLRAYVDNLLNAVENIKIVMPESPPAPPEKPKEWVAKVTERSQGGAIKKVTFSAGG